MANQAPGPVSSDSKLWGLLCVAPIIGWIFSLIVLFSDDKKRDPFMRYYAVIALELLVVQIAASIIVIGACTFLFYLGYIIYLMVKANQGVMVEVPVLSKFARDQKWV